MGCRNKCVRNENEKGELDRSDDVEVEAYLEINIFFFEGAQRKGNLICWHR